MSQPLKTAKQMGSWFVRKNQRHGARLRLFCFPYAGGSAAVYREWTRYLPASVEVVPIEYPGRGGRLSEPPFNVLSKLLQALHPEIVPLLDVPFAFFGHSMGASIAFELCRILRKQDGMLPRRLFVSGRRAAQVPDNDPLTYDLPRDEFLAEVRRLNGTPPEVLEHEELMELMMPLLRADFQLVQTYEYLPERPLDCPITAYGGLGDLDVPRDSIQGWKMQTSGDFRLRMLPGDHFFLKSSQDLLLDSVAAEIDLILASL
jgi:medium-chain acyl-[acyl-carrier-protein] hydrolase